MPQKRQGTDLVELDLGPFRPARPKSADTYRGFYRRANRRRETPRTDDEIEELVARQVALDALGPDDPRVRRRFDGTHYARTAASGRTVHYRGGLVELANLPEYDHDFRVRVELVDGPNGPEMRPTAIAILARPGEVITQGKVSKAHVGEAIRRAVKALSRPFDGGEDAGEPSTGEVVVMMPSDVPAQHVSRTSPRQVDQEAAEVAELSHRVPPGERSRYRWIAQQMGYGTSARAVEKARKRAARARRMKLAVQSR